MEFSLKELHMGMGQPEWEMYQDIPAKEPGATNLCRGLPPEVFPAWLESQIARKYQRVSYYDTPTTVWLMYADSIPVGYIGIRTEIDENWKRWSGNLYYTLRQSARGKGFGTKMLALALDKCREAGMTEVFANASAGNTASARVIEKNGGILLEEVEGSRYYRFEL